jgi:NTP pyrophosphatase (non-canonical NTP hydrolase)
LDVADLQARLRRFAAERDWERFHAPKNLAMALAVEAAELAEIFQWMSEEESRGAHLDPPTHERIADEVADVLLYLLQIADKCAVDVEPAARRKLEKNAIKHPPARRTGA